MTVLKSICMIVLALLAAVTGLSAHGQTGCASNSSAAYINSDKVFELNDGQVSSYLLAQVCGLQPGVSVVLNLLVQDSNTNAVLFNGQAPTDVNGFAHIDVSSVAPCQGLNDLVTITSPGNANLVYTNLICINGDTVPFSGQLIFQFRGVTAEDSRPVQVVGTFVINEDGVIAGGEADINAASGVFEKVPISGTYTYNVLTNTAMVNLTTPLGIESLQVSVNSADDGALVSSGGPLVGTGRLTRMNSIITAVPYFIYGSYATEVSGTLPCDFLCQLPGGGPPTVTSTGILCLGCLPASQPDSAPIYSIVSDQDAGTEPSFGATESGQAGPLDSFYRLVLTNSTTSSNPIPTRYAAYVVSAFEMYLISLDSQDHRAAVSGRAIQVNP